jgi:hypothetical protein
MAIRRFIYLTGEYAGAFVPPLLAYVLLALWAALIWQVAARAPSGAYPGTTTVKASQAPVVLGWRELGQHQGPRSAATRHLGIARAGPMWRIANRSTTRRVDVRTNRYDEIFVERWPLQEGDII